MQDKAKVGQREKNFRIYPFVMTETVDECSDVKGNNYELNSTLSFSYHKERITNNEFYFTGLDDNFVLRY